MAHRLAAGREPVLTGSVVGGLYVVARLAGALSIVGVAYTGVLALFTLPKARRGAGGGRGQGTRERGGSRGLPARCCQGRLRRALLRTCCHGGGVLPPS